ncbi:16972_t:CDS:2 [Funneliformis caledonium]|uniref:16972_t:CDS:1 n=1 Tax=Funneliformis caledonium TaxID=1117310 RepID=A0A9N8YPI0_9GLOM|nr:16972_t:CDS:2 [Funneliformis caledonium]
MDTRILTGHWEKTFDIGYTEQDHGILNRFKNFCSDRPKQDRNLHPIPFLACGPGTGKSRFLQELVNIIRDKALSSGDQNVVSILGSAVFLNVTYGNGTEASDFDVSIGAEASIALRILFSYFVHGNKSFAGFRDKIGKENARELTLSLVLRAIYLSKLKEDKNINELAIIVGIDEVNKLHDKDYDKFLHLVSAVGSASCNFTVDLISEETGSSIPEKTGKVFFAPVFAGTVEGPLQSIITKSMHPPLQLPLHLLDIEDMLKIACNLGFDEDYVYKNNLFRRLISDIGGQVRALEVFYENISVASRNQKLDDINLLSIMNKIEVVLGTRYAFRNHARIVTPVLANAILYRPVNADDSPGKDANDQPVSYKTLKSNGILTLEPTDEGNSFYIRLPYLWVRLLIIHAGNSINKFWHVMIDPNDPFYWQDWEIFNVKFWALRYCLFSALGHEKIKLKELLKGTRYSNLMDEDMDVDIPDHTSICVHYLNHRFPPSNRNYDMVDSEGRICKVLFNDNNKIYKNGGGAEGDGFCFLVGERKIIFLSFQMKWREKDSANPEKIDDKLIKDEYKKSTDVSTKIGLDDWILLILSNRKSTYTMDLPLNCVIVDIDNFNDFYGNIYSSRAQFFAANKKVCINSAKFWELRAIYGCAFHAISFFRIPHTLSKTT